MEPSSHIDFLSVGDVFNDTFIELEDARVTCDVNNENCTITMKFGDKLPYKNVTVVRGVGNAGNAAVSTSRIGLSSAILTITGSDEDGRQITQHYASEKISPVFMKTDSNLPTNNAYVLQYGPERTILVKQEAYPYTVPKELLETSTPKWVYLTSIGKDALTFQHNLITWLSAHPDVKLAFQPGTFQMIVGKEELADIYQRSDIFFCNVEEAERILGLETLGIQELLKRMRALLGPDFAKATTGKPKTVVITDGPKGAYAYDGIDMWFLPIFPDGLLAKERTGAGDAFSSTCTAALSLGHDLPTALMWGAVNSASVVQDIGAQKGLLSGQQIKERLAQAPLDFKPTKLN